VRRISFYHTGKIEVTNDFQNNVTIITGASYGIGRELATQLASQGANLALAARSTHLLEELAEECRDLGKPFGGMAVAIPTDVTDFSQCQNLIQSASQEYGRIDTLINNAGIGIRGRFDKMNDMELLERVMRINYWGSVYCTFHALQSLIKTQGRIVIVSSGAGIIPAPNSAGYAASKHALSGFFDSIRIEIAHYGISVTLIYPDWVETGITTRAIGLDGNPMIAVSAHEKGAMPVDKCVRLMLKAIKYRKRDLKLSSRLHFAAWLRYLFPGIIDFFAEKAFS
jgi:short-subunit dehydrogenase